MSRIRSIHPGIWTDETFAALTDAAMLLYIGLLNEADDGGVFEWKPLQLRMRLRPAKDGGIDALLEELETANVICRFPIGGRLYGAIRNFRKYQKPKFPKFVHPTSSDIANYVGSTAVATVADPPSTPPPTVMDRVELPPLPRNAEAGPLEHPPFPRNAEKVAQMERRMEDGEEKKERGAVAPLDLEKELFQRGKEILGDKAGGMIRRLLTAKGGSLALARAAIEQASTKQDPAEYIGAILRGPLMQVATMKVAL